jgi:glycosyltransferase involved in cell wall biosynthesis
MTLNPSGPATPQSHLRVGFICVRPLSDARFQSGMPHQMANSLVRAGAEIIEYAEWARDTPRGPLIARIDDRLRRACDRFLPSPLIIAAQDLFPKWTARRRRRIASRRSTKIQGLIRSRPSDQPDIFFVCCDQSLLYRTQLPAAACFYSDATFPILRDTYVWHPKHGQAFYEAMIGIERAALAAVNACVYASPVSRQSAIEELELGPQRTHVVPMGANVTPPASEHITAPALAPTRDQCRLLIVAADPIRKRVGLALEATELLRERGIHATLDVIGPGTEECHNNPAVGFHCRLNLSDSDDRATHQQLLRECHLQLLPSLGEAFGIAPIESAHYARPSIVSDAGGLPFVVQHERTGLVIDAQAHASAWADAIEQLIENPEQYHKLSIATLERARSELNWDAWAEQMIEIMHQCINKKPSWNRLHSTDLIH